MKHILFTLTLLFGSGCIAWGQALPSATRADLQVGGSFSFVKPDYSPQNAMAFGIYSDFDFRQHWGASAEFHAASISLHPGAKETTYEIGARYHRQYGIFKPYAKATIGRGYFTFANNFHSNPNTEGFDNPQAGETNGYFLLGIAGGVDFPISNHINVRFEGEYQHWNGGYNLLNGLTPILYSGGVAYHFHPRYPLY